MWPYRNSATSAESVVTQMTPTDLTSNPNPQLSDQTAQPTTSDKVTEAVQIGAAIAEGFVPAPAAEVIAAGVQLEPEVYHLISALIHLFRKQKKTA